MTVFILKIIAMVTMTIDHIGFSFFPTSLTLRCIGRFAFPIYAFLMAEGFRHFKDEPKRVEHHLQTYVLITLLSEIAYDIMEFHPLSAGVVFTSQSAMITLLLAFLGLLAIDKWKDKPLYVWSAILLTAAVDYFALANYKFAGVLLVYAFYWYLNRFEGKSYVERLITILGIFFAYIVIYHWGRCGFCGLDEYIAQLQGNNAWWYSMHILIAFLLATYTGKLGYHNKTLNNVYRYYYPAHMLLLGLAGYLI